MARTKTKGTSLFVKIVLLMVIAYLSYVSINFMVRISDKKSDNRSIDEQIAIQRDKNKQYEDIKNADIDDDTVEAIARENGYTYPDEKVYESIS